MREFKGWVEGLTKVGGEAVPPLTLVESKIVKQNAHIVEVINVVADAAGNRFKIGGVHFVMELKPVVGE
jgi:hypothetical protein